MKPIDLSASYLGTPFSPPHFDEKIRHSWSSLSLFLLPLPLFLVQLHLLIRYDPLRTLPLRIALIPPIALLSLPASFSRYFDLHGSGQLTGQAQHFNFGAGVYSIYAILRAIEWGTMREKPSLKVAGGSSGGKREKGREIDAEDRLPSPPLPLLFPGSWTPLEFDLLSNMRGIGWSSGPPHSPPALPLRRYTYGDRLLWSLRRLPAFALTYTFLDLLAVLIRDPRVFPHLATVPFTSIWTAPFGLFGRFAPYVVTLTFGSMVYLVIQSHHIALSIIMVLVLGDTPTRWEPLPFSAPLSATSVGDLWSNRWHHLFRQSFLHVGYTPVRRVVGKVLGRKAGRAAGVMAVFAVSALMHDWGQAGMVLSRPEWKLTQTGRFFLLQGVLVVLEQAWSDVTRRKVQGPVGWAWTMTVLTLTGTWPTDEWTRRGLALSWVFTPKFTRPVADWLVDATAAYRW